MMHVVVHNAIITYILEIDKEPMSKVVKKYLEQESKSVAGSTFEEVRDLLVEKIKREKARLKTYGTKTDSFAIAHVLTQHIRAIKAGARWKEIHDLKSRFTSKYGKHPKRKSLEVILSWLMDREKALASIRDALRNDAELRDLRRPRRSSVVSGTSRIQKSTSSKRKKHRKKK